MKILFIPIISVLLFSCKKSDEGPGDEGPIKLLRKEATAYTGELLTSEYVYDSQNRIVAVKQAKGYEPMAVAVTITYNGNEATLISHPTYDPAYNITKEVRLKLDATGKLLEKISYSYLESSGSSPTRRYKYDTLTCIYDAAGFLQETTRGYLDSVKSILGTNFGTYTERSTSRDSFTTDASNLTKKIEHSLFTKQTTDAAGNIIYATAGSTTYYKAYAYTKSYPNKADFTNIAILNETQDFSGFMDYYGWMDYLEPFAEVYQNMPGKTEVQNIERDTSGSIISTYNASYENERTYNPESLLSTVDVLSPGTYNIKINFFYGR